MKRRCQVCNKQFTLKKYWQKYCSIACKQAMWAIKRFDKKVLINFLKLKED